jgi:hypothetical protein
MPFIIDQSFFVGTINLPNTSDAKVIEDITNFISEFEPDCLLKTMGYPLYKAYNSTSSASRMTDLLNGAEYTDYWTGELKKWRGIKHDTNKSLIAYYVFFQIMNSRETQVTGVSTIKGKTNAGQSVSNGDKMNAAWRKFSEETYEMLCFLWSKNDTRRGGTAVYPEFTWHQFLVSKSFSRPISEFF